MQQTKKVFLVKLPDGTIAFIPLEAISGCEIVTSKRIKFWIHDETVSANFFEAEGSRSKTRELGKDDVDAILKNEGICFVAVDYENKLLIPTQGFGTGKAVFYLKQPPGETKETLQDAREYAEALKERGGRDEQWI